MTTANTRTPKVRAPFRLPDPPPRGPDEMTSYDHVHQPGNSHHLIQHLGNPETTLVVAERWIVLRPEDDKTRARRPDLLIAFDVDPQAYKASNGYIVSEQGKPPDFVLEVASESTADEDTGPKRVDYAALGIREYWRFDETGRHHGTRLAGDRLVEGRYEPIDIDELADRVLQGYSAALNLNLRWENGQLGWHDPATGQHIATFESERAARIQAEARAEGERTRAEEERTRAEEEHAARVQAEARAAQLEAELRRLRNG